MMVGRKKHTVGNRIRYTADYCEWLADGVRIDSITITSSSATLAVTTPILSEGKNKAYFFGVGGVLGETATISFQMTDSLGNIKNDTGEIFVVAA